MLVRSAGVQLCGGLANAHLDFKRPTGDKHTPVIHGHWSRSLRQPWNQGGSGVVLLCSSLVTGETSCLMLSGWIHLCTEDCYFDCPFNNKSRIFFPLMNCFTELPICSSSILPGCMCFCVWKKAGFKCQKEGIRFPLLLPTTSTFTSLFPPLNVKWCLWSVHMGLELFSVPGVARWPTEMALASAWTFYSGVLRGPAGTYTDPYLKWEPRRGRQATHESCPWFFTVGAKELTAITWFHLISNHTPIGSVRSLSSTSLATSLSESISSVSYCPEESLTIHQELKYVSNRPTFPVIIL